MSDDVPLARAPGRLTDWWRRWPVWDAYFATAAATTAGFVATARPESAPVRAGALLLLAGLVAWYVGFGRHLMRAEIEDRRGHVYLLGALALYVPAVTLVDSVKFALFALCPQAYMVLAARPATGYVVALNATHVLVHLGRTRDPADTVTGPLPFAAVVVVMTAIFGTWAQQVAKQNDERAVLIEELESSRAAVAHLSHEAGVTAERQRLAGDIHDTVAQGLSSVVMLVQAADAELDRDPARARGHLALALDTARDNLAEVRALVAALTPTALTGSSLPEALGRLVDRFGAETGVPARFTATGAPRPLPAAVEVVLLRAAQESLANVRKHAAARSVTVRLGYDPAAVALEVRDDGRGIDPAPAGGGYGLRAMGARVAQVAGSLTVAPGVGSGTTVRVEVPA